MAKGDKHVLTAGTVLNSRYEVWSSIAEAGGAVYIAIDRNLGDRKVAIKSFADGPADKSGAPTRADAMRLASLEHGHLVPIIDFFENGNEACLVLAVTEGRPLASIAAERDVSVSEALAWIEQITRVLAYLHGQSPPVPFRDLKPSNVLVDDVGRVRLVPFGVAQALEAEQSARPFLRDAEAAAYGAAEQQGGRDAVDERADIYSVGAILYRLLTGERPPPALAVLSGQSAPVQPRSVNAGIMPALENIIVRAMAPRREDRFASVRELRAALAQVPITGSAAFIEAAPAPRMEPMRPTLAPKPFPPPVARDPAPSGGGGGALAAAPMPLPVFPPRRESPWKRVGAIALVAVATFSAGALWSRFDGRAVPAAGSSSAAAASPVAEGASPAPGPSSTPTKASAVQQTALLVESRPPGARVAVDGQMVVGENGETVTPMKVVVKPGRHEIWVEKEGFESFRTTVPKVALGTTRAIDATLQASAPAPATVPAGYPTPERPPMPQPGAAQTPGGYGVHPYPPAGQSYPTGPSVPSYNPAPVPTLSAPGQQPLPQRETTVDPRPTSTVVPGVGPPSDYGNVKPPPDFRENKVPGL